MPQDPNTLDYPTLATHILDFSLLASYLRLDVLPSLCIPHISNFANALTYRHYQHPNASNPLTISTLSTAPPSCTLAVSLNTLTILTCLTPQTLDYINIIIPATANVHIHSPISTDSIILNISATFQPHNPYTPATPQSITPIYPQLLHRHKSDTSKKPKGYTQGLYSLDIISLIGFFKYAFTAVV